MLGFERPPLNRARLLRQPIGAESSGNPKRGKSGCPQLFPDAGGTGDTGCIGAGPVRSVIVSVHGLDGIALLHRRGRRGFLGLGLYDWRSGNRWPRPFSRGLC